MIQFNNNIVAQFNTITEDDIDFLENLYDFKFPKEIRMFYLTYNAGKLEKDEFILEEESFHLHGFYSIKEGYATLDEKMRLNYTDDWWPKKLIPFGYDSGGEDYCFDKESGEIYFLNSEEEDEDGNVLAQYLCPNFVEFINHMV